MKKIKLVGNQSRGENWTQYLHEHRSMEKKRTEQECDTCRAEVFLLSSIFLLAPGYETCLYCCKQATLFAERLTIKSGWQKMLSTLRGGWLLEVTCMKEKYTASKIFVGRRDSKSPGGGKKEWQDSWRKWELLDFTVHEVRKVLGYGVIAVSILQRTKWWFRKAWRGQRM